MNWAAAPVLPCETRARVRVVGMVVPQGLLPGKALPRGNPPRPAHAWKGGSLAAVPLPARQCPNTHHACFCSINKCTPTTLSPPQLQRSGACRKTSSRAWQPPLPRSVPAELPAGHDNKAGSLPNMRTPVVQRFRTFFFIMLALNESLGSVHGLGQDVFSAQPPKPGTPDGVASAAGNARSLPSPGGWSVLCNVYVKTHTRSTCVGLRGGELVLRRGPCRTRAILRRPISCMGPLAARARTGPDQGLAVNPHHPLPPARDMCGGSPPGTAHCSRDI